MQETLSSMSGMVLALESQVADLAQRLDEMQHRPI